MANTKHSVAREIIIDRLLHDRRGYSLYEILETVNQGLELEGYQHVSLNTIRNDIDNLQYLYKQKIEVKTKGYRNYYRYKDPNSTIFNNVLTRGEIQQLRSALLCIRARDQIRGSLMYQQLSDRLSSILDIDSASDPIIIYKNIPPMHEMKRFSALYELILSQTPAIITVFCKKEEKEKQLTIHPYHLYQDERQEWSLLCHDATNDHPAEIPLKCIKRLVTAKDIEFIPNHDFTYKDYYKNKSYA